MQQKHEFNEQDVCVHCGEALGYAGATGSTHCGDLDQVAEGFCAGCPLRHCDFNGERCSVLS